MFLAESRRLVRDGRKVLWEWICEMQSERTVAAAVFLTLQG